MKVAAVAIMLAATSAWAQEEAFSAPSPPVPAERRWVVSLIGGVGGFTGGLSSISDVGPVWGVQLDGRLWRSLHVEVGYHGFVFPLTDTRLALQSLWGHGLSAIGKLSIPYTRRMNAFIGAGAGGLYIYPSFGAGALYRSDVALELPAVIGVEFQTTFFKAGIRGTWRGLLGERLTDPHEVGRKSGGLLSAELTLGLRL